MIPSSPTPAAPPPPLALPATSARCLALAALVAGMVLSLPLAASPLLRCELLQGGRTQLLASAPVADPYGVQAVDVGSHFRFKAVVVGNENKVDYIKLYTYYQSRRQAVLLHQATYPAPLAQAVPPPAALTGINYLYSPNLERELQYGCALFEVAP